MAQIYAGKMDRELRIADIYEYSQQEWDAAVQCELEKLDLTYEQLADMAQRRDFNSYSARKLWLSIGGTDGVRSQVWSSGD